MAAKKRRGYYNVRDLLGHWVKPRSMRQKMCPHACCQGRRVHPKNFPVLLPKELLRNASESELADHYGKHSGNGNARRQIEAEMRRRDLRDARRRNAASRSRARREERTLEVESQWLAAERATNGNMLNSRGRRLGISERRLFSSSRDRQRYASDEFLRYVDDEARRGVTVGGRTDRQRYRGAR